MREGKQRREKRRNEEEKRTRGREKRNSRTSIREENMCKHKPNHNVKTSHTQKSHKKR
jgi:hypothetical protein